MFDPRFGCHTVVTSTGGAALCAVVSGPLVAELGFNSGRNALGPGYRANATVGRALRLVAMNVLGARSDTLDGSSLGHPGKYTMLVAEEPPPEGWLPLRVELGYGEERHNGDHVPLRKPAPGGQPPQRRSRGGSC